MAGLRTIQKDINKRKEKLKRVVRMLNSSQTTNMLADLSIKLIRARVKSGYGINRENGRVDKRRLPPLSPQYVKYRQGIVEFTTRAGQRVKFNVKPPALGQYGSPSRSNLTLTGQLLDSFGKEVKSGSFKIFIKNNRRTDVNKTNRQIAEYMTKRQPFFALTDGEKRILQQELTLMVEKILSPR